MYLYCTHFQNPDTCTASHLLGETPRKLQYFPILSVFVAPVEDDPVGILSIYLVSQNKSRYRYCAALIVWLNCFIRTPVRDGQIDGQTDSIYTALAQNRAIRIIPNFCDSDVPYRKTGRQLRSCDRPPGGGHGVWPLDRCHSWEQFHNLHAEFAQEGRKVGANWCKCHVCLRDLLQLQHTQLHTAILSLAVQNIYVIS